jgi:ligand-binding sensor domain-containing protein
VAQSGRYISRFSNGSSVDISGPEFGSWVAPFFLDIENPDTLYLALKDVYVSYNRGTTWTNRSNGTVSNVDKTAMLQAPSNPNIIYLTTDTILYKSTDRGLSWSTLGRPVSSGLTMISYIAIDHNDPQHLWISCANYISGNKIYESTDGGISWTNLSLNLPNIPINCIVQENNSNNGLYIGTDEGVYYYNSNLGSWIDFNNQLPNVIVMELEIAPSIGKIRAGTYGRGLWESDIYSNSSSTDEPLTLKEELILFPNPANNIVNIKIPEDWKAERVLFEIYDINGKRIEAEYQNTTNFSKNIEYLANGIYVIAISSNSRHFVKRLVKQ